MTDVSPSSQKVDDFLSSLSQLSQERLKDNQNRQRNLQRDIDELRRTPGMREHAALRLLSPLPSQLLLSHGIRELSFNRSARGQFYEKWKDAAPELPKRPSSSNSLPSSSSVGGAGSGSKTRPMKPTKPDALSAPENPPKLPQRPVEIVETIETINVDLLRPVARKSKPDPKPRPEFKSQLALLFSTSKDAGSRLSPPLGTSKQKSFAALEEKIRSSGTKSLEDALDAPPLLPARNKTLILLRLPKPAPSLPEEPSKTTTPKALPPKPESSKPPIPVKPKKTLKLYEEGNTELLKQLLRQLSPTKPAPEKKPVSGEFVPEDHIKKLQERRLKPDKPIKLKPAPVVAEDKPEAISFLLKLKATKPSPPKPESKPEALRQFESMRKLDYKPLEPETRASQLASTSTKEPALPSDLTSKPVPAAQFHAHLSSLLKANTEPLASPKPQAPVRRSTAPLESSTPLTHPNKSRSKGPKRRLPKSQKSGSSTGAPTPASASYASSISSSVSDAAASEKQPIKKKPPPIKGKKPALEVKPRRIASGELFI